MLLLTVTTETQGRRPTDICAAVDGELVTIAEAFDCDQYEPTSPYPRSFVGLSSGSLSTTAVVRDVPLSEADFRIAVRGYIESHYYLGDDEAGEAEVTWWAEHLATWARLFEAGAVVERWWDMFTERGDWPLRRELPPGRRRAST